MKIFVCECKQESNSFNPIPTPLSAFDRGGTLRGERLLQASDGEHAALGGILDAIREFGDEAIPGVAMRAGSGGPVEQKVVDGFLKETLTALKTCMPVDGVFLSLHGAMLTEQSEDACGDILEAVRSCVGERASIAAAFDLHANITEKVFRNADFIAGFRTYPHMDQRNTGYRAACAALESMHGQPRVMAYATVPMMASASDYTTKEGALSELMQYAHDLVDSGKLRDFSVFQVQPWLDVHEIASAVVTVADDPETAIRYANELANREFTLRETLVRRHEDIDEIIGAACREHSGKPVVLVDSADSPNAGATCDSAEVLRHLLPYRETLRAAFPINDTPTVEKAFSAGVGAELTVELGATRAPMLSRPVTLSVRVKSLHEGTFMLEGPAGRGSVCVIGRTAVLLAGKLQILVTEHASRIGDPQFYRGFGIEPTLCDLVVIKACTSFRAAYEPIASVICNADTMGSACSDLKALPYRRLPVPMYPFTALTEKDIKPARVHG